MTLEYLATSIIIILLPGSGVLYTLTLGLSQGWRASVFAAFGCTLGIVPHAVASIVGLTALLHTSATAFQVIRILGVAYLAYMAFAVLREGGGLTVSATKAEAAPLRIVTSGFLINILNPKLSLFFLAFLPQFVPIDASDATVQMLLLAGVFMALTFIVFLGYGAFAAAARTYVVTRPAVMLWLRRSFAGAFAALGLRLALAER